MTLAVTVVCQDGVVVAADSRTTLANDRTLRVASDFTHKVFESGRVAVTRRAATASPGGCRGD